MSLQSVVLKVILLKSHLCTYTAMCCTLLSVQIIIIMWDTLIINSFVSSLRDLNFYSTYILKCIIYKCDLKKKLQHDPVPQTGKETRPLNAITKVVTHEFTCWRNISLINMTSLPPRISSELLEVSTAMWQSLQTARACASSSRCQLALTAAIFSGPAFLPPPAQSRSAFVIFFTSSISEMQNRDYNSQKNSSVTSD